MFRRWLLGLFVLLIASGLWPGALAASEEPSELSVGGMVALELSDEGAEFAFTPSANGLYAVYLFPASDEMTARAEVSVNGQTLVKGDGRMKLVSCRLNAGTEYALQVSGEGSALLEVARETLSRSFGMPLELADGEDYSKLIARSGDVHWYSMTAESSGAALLTCVPNAPGLRLRLSLFGADGRRLEVSETLASGTAVLSAAFEVGEVYYIRVAGSGEGKYSLGCLRSENQTRAQSVGLSAREMTLQGRATAKLEVGVYPEDACELVYLDSAATKVARAWPSGYVEGLQPGKAAVTAYAYGGARSTCSVTVAEVPLQGLSLSPESLTLTEGDTRSLIAMLNPTNATQRRLSWSSGDEGVVTVDKNGVVTAAGQGETIITATAEDAGLAAQVVVTVTAAKPKYRALLVGEQEYAPSVETVRDGSEKSVQGVNGLLNTVSFTGGGYYSVETLMDGSRDEVIAAIRETFAGAREADTSLVYITCHGFYQAGMTFFLMADGSVLSAADLERELRVIPGEIVLLIDCCGSGGVVGEASSAEDMLEGIVGVFQGAVGGANAHGSKYRIIASARLDQDSYRIGFGGGGMSTVFARALCDAAGWNMDLAAPSALNADVDYDGKVTLDELGRYLVKRAAWYLALAGDYSQTICVYPEADPGVIFERGGE